MAPINMVPMDKWLEGPTNDGADPNAPPDPTGNPAARFQAFRGLFRDAVGRITNRKPEQRRDYARAALLPAMEALAGGGRGATINALLCDIEAACEAWDKDKARVISEQIFLTASEALHCANV